MGKYLRKQFQVSMFNLEHHTPSDFYLSCWQSNRSALPLLCVRAFIFLGCVAIILASMILTGRAMNFGLWFIFLTHWGLIMNIVASCFGVVVSFQAYFKGSIEPSFTLPWYVKIFWAAYDVALVMAFFITLYYYSLLTFALDEEMEFALNAVLDFFIHGMNSILMFALLMTSRHPGRMLHFVYPLVVGIVYLIFTVIYYFAGGKDPFGNAYIYPTLDWATPGVTSIMLVITAVILVLMHVLVVGLTACRNWLARRYGGRHAKSVDMTPIPYTP